MPGRVGNDKGKGEQAELAIKIQVARLPGLIIDEIGVNANERPKFKPQVKGFFCRAEAQHACYKGRRMKKDGDLDKIWDSEHN